MPYLKIVQTDNKFKTPSGPQSVYRASVGSTKRLTLVDLLLTNESTHSKGVKQRHQLRLWQRYEQRSCCKSLLTCSKLLHSDKSLSNACPAHNDCTNSSTLPTAKTPPS